MCSNDYIESSTVSANKNCSATVLSERNSERKKIGGSTVSAKKYRLRRINKRKQDGAAKMGKQAGKTVANANVLTSTGTVCTMLSEGHRVQALLGTQAAHMQFFERRVDGKRSMYDV